MFKSKKAFTLIELLVVIAIIGILATISVLALSNARAKSRDAKRAGDMKQIQTALELFFNDKNRYPTVEEWNTGKIYSTSTGVTSTYMQIIPTAPTPADGTCTNDKNAVSYTPSSDLGSYSISFCLGNTTGTLTPGPKCLTPGGIIDVDCSVIPPGFIVNFNVNTEQYAQAVQQASDGGYIIAGATKINDPGDIYLIKTDASGNKVWDNAFNLAGYQYAQAVQQTSDGGYIILGYTDSNHGDLYLIKTDASGNETWSKTFGDADPQEPGYDGSIQQTPDGGYIMAGSSTVGGDYNQGYLVKTDVSGNLTWEKTFARTDFAQFYSVRTTSDGGYILSGRTYVYGSTPNMYLVKTDVSGNKTWEKVFGNPSYEARFAQEISGGGYVLGGMAFSGVPNAYLVKTDAGGNLLWSKAYGGSSANFQYGVSSFRPTSDGGFIFVGNSRENGIDTEIYMLKADASGNELWNKTIASSGDQYVYSIQQTSDGGYVMVGSNNAVDPNDDVYLVKTDASGNIQ